MPKLIGFKSSCPNGSIFFGHARSIDEAVTLCAGNDTHYPVFTGTTPYDYRTNSGNIIIGRRPIGPHRSAMQRQKRRV